MAEINSRQAAKIAAWHQVVLIPKLAAVRTLLLSNPGSILANGDR
jgi:hypothetical protein